MVNAAQVIASASAPCGISVVSSYATGVGSVMAVDRRVSVKLLVSTGVTSEIRTGRLLAVARETLGMNPRKSLLACTSSSVPSGTGLKTSSAVITALSSVLLRSEGRSHSAGHVVEASNAVSRQSGLTQAGSVDDNYAAALGGVVVSQTEGAKLLARWDAPTGLEVIIAVPRFRGHAAHHSDRTALLRPHREKVEKLLNNLLRSGDVFSVMSEAAFTHCEALGYSPAPLRAALRAGALGVTLSGKGPALAAVIHRASVRDQVLRAWRQILPVGTRILHSRPENVGLMGTHEVSAETTAKLGRNYAYQNG